MARKLLTISEVIAKVEGHRKKRGKEPILTGADVLALVGGWKNVTPKEPSTYSPSSFYYNTVTDQKRAEFDAAQAKLATSGIRGALEAEAARGGVAPAFGLSPREATRLLLTGRF